MNRMLFQAKFLFLIACVVLGNTKGFGQELVQYKQVDTTKLFIEVHYPPHIDSTIAYPAMIFFFGGGWKSGSREHFRNHAKYFSQKGIVCFLADYRTANKHGTTPFESLEDAKSAIRFIRMNSALWGVDSQKIIASGGSADGQLAAATALLDGYNAVSDDPYISAIPNALVLYNPVIDNGPDGYGYERIGSAYKSFSPLHNIKRGAPPTIILLGTNDELVPVETAQYYKLVMEKVESRCDLILYEGRGHGFFNYGNKDFENTLLESGKFLRSLGY